jgi:hypothetical protein
MLTAEVNAPPAPDIRRDIEAAMEAEVYPLFRQWANDLLDLRLAGPNKGDVYTVTVDRAAVPGREYIASAKREVTVRFIHATISLALNILAQEMAAAIDAAASPRSWIRRGEIRSNILIFYNGSRVSASTEIKQFVPGDYIQLIPSHINQAYANASKFGATGYMGRAARRLRSKLRINKRDSALTLFAGRSRAAWNAIKENGQHMTKPEWGAWAITLRLRQNTVFRG